MLIETDGFASGVLVLRKLNTYEEVYYDRQFA